MSARRTEALVLRATDFGESDRILHLLVPDAGRLTAIAKGARRSVRRFPGTLDLFNRVRVEIAQRGRGMARLEQARLLDAFTPLRTDCARFALGCYLLELFDRLAPEGGDRADSRRLFEFALAALRAVATQPPEPRLRVLLELRALDALGLRPELHRCVRCGVPPGSGERPVFCIPDGGIVCAGCAQGLESGMPVHLGTLRMLAQALRFDLERLDRLAPGPTAVEQAQLLLSRFHRYHLGVELRSERFLGDVLAARSVAAG